MKNPNPNLKFQADHEKVYLVLFNLVDNAFKFTESGMIEFGYRLEDDFLVFFVKDTGPGISEKFNDLIFERFYQIEDPTSKSHPGLGLGLSISKSLTELMGGKIWVLSEIGKGSEFCFSIPMDRPE